MVFNILWVANALVACLQMNILILNAMKPSARVDKNASNLVAFPPTLAGEHRGGSVDLACLARGLFVCSKSV